MAGSSTAEPQAAFYLDLRSPEAYLAAERVLGVLTFPAEWIPIRSTQLPAADTLEGFRCEADVLAYRERITTRAEALGVQPLRWPEPFPLEGDLALRAATYAKSIGRAVAFVLAAFRQAFAAGRDLAAPDNVVIAGSACEMHPTATLKAVETRGVRASLDRATQTAIDRGVRDVPAIWLPDGRVFHGELALEQAVPA
ncbi:MAG TPA: DsbA family protein [Solirubrobacteraceae bacterium]